MTLTKLAFAAALVVAGHGIAPTTANASSIGFSGTWEESISAPAPAPFEATLSFDNLVTIFTSGLFTGFEAVAVQDLDLVRTGFVTGGASAVAQYAIDTTTFTGESWKVYENDLGDVITFDLDLDATWQRTFDISDGDVNWQQGVNSSGVFEFTGIYNLPDGSTLLGRGELNASLTNEAMVFEVTQAAIPLPAGVWLLGSGGFILGALRLRKRAA